eukprot:TRINITY_DN54415_c0_g1_i1.p1 TRINITY_DN54415_c0_g1~~TRINITY_DN54415_c0_g1_i1.p1  ORF type:complete len:301 (+),score=63.84 TRINITY_DN54415_c0_g1_i1:69-971(+)
MADAGDEAFSASAWSPEEQSYGLLELLLCRETMMPELSALNGCDGGLKALDSRVCDERLKASGRARDRVPSDLGDDSDVSEGEPMEPTEKEWWGRGRPGSWWRVRDNLAEACIVRSGVSLASAAVRSVLPGQLLQQAGIPRALTKGRARGCIRMPVRPEGWVTADATRAGGTQFLMRASTPTWQVIFSVTDGNSPDVVVRASKELNSDQIGTLRRGDVVEQAGPSVERPDGIIRMPVSFLPSSPGRNGRGDGSGTRKLIGWVTADASEAGGPTFFEQMPDPDGGSKRRSRGHGHQQSNGN